MFVEVTPYISSCLCHKYRSSPRHFIVATPLLFTRWYVCLTLYGNRFRINSKHHANVITKVHARERLFNLILFFPLLIQSQLATCAAHFIRIIILIVTILSKFHNGLKKLFKNSLSLLRVRNLLNQKEKWYLKTFEEEKMVCMGPFVSNCLIKWTQ